MFTLLNLPYLLASIPVIVWLLGEVSRLSMLSLLRPVTDVLNTVVFLGPILFYDYLGLMKFNVLSTAGGPWWYNLVYIGTMGLIFFGVGKLVLLFLR